MLAAAAVLSTSAPLVGCGSTTGHEIANTEATAPTPGVTSPVSHPTGPPWPRFPVDDYTYELRANCFCAERGPLLITVRDGRVTDVVYARGAVEHPAGQHTSGGWLRMTINDVIQKANDPHSQEVEVRWPRTQQYPSWVWINRSLMPVDGGIQYQVRHVKATMANTPDP